MKIFYVSDLHIGHKNCLRFDNRPFKDLREQNEKLVEIWNSRVNPKDHVWILGDVLWKTDPESVETIKKLNGKKFVVTGNHDGKWLKDSSVKKLFAKIYHSYHLFFDNRRKVVLSHYPIFMYDGVLNGSFHLYGHVHIDETDCKFIHKWRKEYEEELKIQYGKDFKVNMFNVGLAVSYMEWGPKTLDEILEANK